MSRSLRKYTNRDLTLHINGDIYEGRVLAEVVASRANGHGRITDYKYFFKPADGQKFEIHQRGKNGIEIIVFKNEQGRRDITLVKHVPDSKPI